MGLQEHAFYKNTVKSASINLLPLIYCIVNIIINIIRYLCLERTINQPTEASGPQILVEKFENSLGLLPLCEHQSAYVWSAMVTF